jgi:valyl-tRNA synthetase
MHVYYLCLLQNTTDAEKAQITRIEALFKALAKVESITFLADAEQPPLSSSVLWVMCLYLFQ